MTKIEKNIDPMLNYDLKFQIALKIANFSRIIIIVHVQFRSTFLSGFWLSYLGPLVYVLAKTF